ncbi:MAG: nucleotidyltransferase domain-containing protein [Proteobacteria bacterium]|nr:nucleotidyltransferase domain-containing protein [Pseudomonadota bacterium]
MKTLDIAPEDLEEVKKILQYCVPQYTVWAFGSRVTGKAKKFSDLDLVIMTDTRLDIHTLSKLRDVFSISDLPFKVDVVDWSSTREEFKKIIQNDYIVIQEKPNHSEYL